MIGRYKRFFYVSALKLSLILSAAGYVYYALIDKFEVSFTLGVTTLFIISLIINQSYYDSRSSFIKQSIVKSLRAVPGCDYKSKLTHDVITLPGIKIEIDLSGCCLIYHGNTIESFNYFNVSEFSSYMRDGKPIVDIKFNMTRLEVEGC